MCEFTVFVESLRRLYQNNSISKEKVDELFNCEKISEKDMLYIFNAL